MKKAMLEIVNRYTTENGINVVLEIGAALTVMLCPIYLIYLQQSIWL